MSGAAGAGGCSGRARSARPAIPRTMSSTRAAPAGTGRGSAGGAAAPPAPLSSPRPAGALRRGARHPAAPGAAFAPLRGRSGRQQPGGQWVLLAPRRHSSGVSLQAGDTPRSCRARGRPRHRRGLPRSDWRRRGHSGRRGQGLAPRRWRPAPGTSSRAAHQGPRRLTSFRGVELSDVRKNDQPESQVAKVIAERAASEESSRKLWSRDHA